MKKSTKNAAFCCTVAAVVVLAIAIDRKSASSVETDIQAGASARESSPKRKGAAGKSFAKKASRKAAEEASSRGIPKIEPGMDETAFSQWLDPRPPRTGDEMENIPEDEDEYPIRQLDAQARFRAAVFSTLADKSLNHAEFGRSLLASATPSLRSLGAALLVETGSFGADAAAAVAADPDAAVPLSILEWIRERGSDADLAALEAAFAARGMSVADLLAVLQSLSSSTGGAREALDRLIKLAPEDELPDLLAAVANSESAAYDARMQALMALRGVAPFSVADGVMVGLELAAEPPDESLWGESLDLYSDLIDLAADDKAPYKVWDVLVRDIEFLSSLDYENAVRDMANYIENGVRGDDPVIQEGAWRMVDAYISMVRNSGAASLAAVAEPLARLERLNEKLKPFDPEFAEPDAEPGQVAVDDVAEAPETDGGVSEPDSDEAGEEGGDDADGAAIFDAFGNPAGSGASVVPIGVEIVEPYRP